MEFIKKLCYFGEEVVVFLNEMLWICSKLKMIRFDRGRFPENPGYKQRNKPRKTTNM